MRTNKLDSLAINQNGFIFDPATGYSYNANDTAICILENLIAGKDIEEIAQYLVSEYETNYDEAVSDVEYFFRVLENYNLVDSGNVY